MWRELIKESIIYIIFNGDRYYGDEGYKQGRRDDKIRREENRKPYEQKEQCKDNTQ